MLQVPQPNQWSCPAASLASLLEKPYLEIIERIGHDGSKIIYPDKPEPQCRQGFSIPEILDACISYGRYLVEIIADPITDNDRHVFSPDFIGPRMEYYMNGHPGLLGGEVTIGHPHIVAWDGFDVYDPRLNILYNFSDNYPEKISLDTFYRLI